MYELDETDVAILELLIEDARRPFRDIAEQVDLSPPAISDRVDRLRDIGIIQRFTVQVDRSRLATGSATLIEIQPAPAVIDETVSAIRQQDEVEHIFRLGDGRVVVHAHLPTTDIVGWLEGVIDVGQLTSVNAQPVVAHHEQIDAVPVSFDLTCVVCGNDVDGSGELQRFDGEIKAFCCESCLARYESKYAELAEGV